MEATNRSQLIPRPFINALKVKKRQIILRKEIKHETRDLYRIAGFRYVRRGLFKESTMLENFDCIIVTLLDKLYGHKSRFLNEVYRYRQQQYLFDMHVLPEGKAKLREITESKEEKYLKENDFRMKNPNESHALETSQIPAKENMVFTHSVSFSDYWAGEVQGYESEYLFGRQYAMKNCSFEKPEKDINLLHTAEGVIDNPVFNQTFLASITLQKLLLTALITTLACISELLIYSKILGAIFHMEGIKMYFAGSVIFLFSKTNAILLYETVHEYFKKMGKLFAKGVSSFFLIIFILSLLYSVCTGILYHQFTQDERHARNYTMLQQQSMELQDALETDPQNVDLLQQLDENHKEQKELSKKLSEEESGVLKIITIGFAGLVILLFTSVLFSMSLIFGTAYKLKKDCLRTARAITDWEAKFNSQKQRISSFRNRAFHIQTLYGQLEYLRRLEHGTPIDAFYSPHQNTPLPLNGNQAHSFNNYNNVKSKF